MVVRSKHRTISSESDLEGIITDFRRKGDNRFCAECGERSPQYVCTNFNIFVCNICSGIHREFCHRIKSISISKFTSLEVESLLNGGNKASNDHFLANHKKKDFMSPNPGDIERIRRWIHIKYVEKSWIPKKWGDPQNNPNLKARAKPLKNIPIGLPPRKTSSKPKPATKSQSKSPKNGQPKVPPKKVEKTQKSESKDLIDFNSIFEFSRKDKVPQNLAKMASCDEETEISLDFGAFLAQKVDSLVLEEKPRNNGETVDFVSTQKCSNQPPKISPKSAENGAKPQNLSEKPFDPKNGAETAETDPFASLMSQKPKNVSFGKSAEKPRNSPQTDQNIVTESVQKESFESLESLFKPETIDSAPVKPKESKGMTVEEIERSLLDF